MTKRVFVVEDHQFWREELVRFLNSLDNMQVCGQSGTAEAALEQIPNAIPDVMVIDLSLPKMSGFEFASLVKKRYPKIACVMLTGHQVKAVRQRAQELGLQGYVVKGDADELESAMRNFLQGKTYFQEVD